MKKHILFLVISTVSLFAQQFTEMTSISLSGVQESSVAWGDYDNDGDLDLLLTGNDGSNKISKIYNNNGGSFSEVSSISLTGIYRGSATWGDYNNDGYIDILLTGHSGSSAISKIYKNDGIGNFVEQSSIVIQSCYYSSALWCDYDNDGDLDFLISGKVSGGGGSFLYKNNGDNTFTHQSSISLPSISQGANAWGDYDNDGYTDILFTGYTGSAGLTKIYKNDGSGNFTEQSSISLTGVYNSSAAWGDYDNDGDLDFLISGNTGSGSQESIVYKNNGNGTFSEQTSIKLTAVYSGSAAWGDYDNDGYLDILLTGLGSSRVSKVYKNSGSGNFSDQTDITLTGVYFSSVGWGDYDNDGDLDFLISGNSSSGRVSKIYRNNASTANTPPIAPTNLTTSVDGKTVTFGWDKSTDTQTSQNGLTYNLYIGTSSGGAQVKSPMSSTSTGYRRVVQLGNTNHKNSVQISLLCGVTYYWSVQAIDNSFAGSSFTIEQTIYVPEFTEQTSIALTGVSDGSVAWGDYDNDEDLDILLTGYTGSERISKIYKNTNGSFSEDAGISLTSVYCSSVAWGDYDNDGDLDILLTGNSASGKVTRIYNNNGDATFTQQSGISITGVDYSSVAWGDYDNDGDLDILLTGSGSSVISRIYINNGDRSFTLSEISLQGICIGSAVWGDYNNDKYLDILLTGSIAGGDPGWTSVYKNNGDGTFTETCYPTPTSSCSAVWGDYNNDGYLDFILTGYYASGGYDISKIYKNNGDGTFTATSISLTGVSLSSVAWGDYDNDGDLDLLLTGLNGSTRISKIYKNNGDESFTEQTNISLTSVNRSSVAWGDYDNDKDLDVLLTGYSGSAYVSKIYRNNANTANTPPSAPQNLITTMDGNYVTFNWDKSTDSQTSQNGLTYNIYIGTTSLEAQKKSPMANTSTGYRKTVQLGNTNHNNSISILFPQAGNYYWSVQAIDNNFAGSAFATEQSFNVTPIITEETSISLTGVSKSAVCWGDYDDDNDLDILLTGSTGTGTLTSKIYKNNGNGSFTAQAITLLTSVSDGSVAWVDYDNDGDLDIFLSGANVPQIWQNIGSGVFAYQSGISFPSVYYSSAAWGDYNNDGLLDLLLTGDVGGLAISKIYKNNGDQSFTEQTDISLVAVREGSVAWGDYNNDGNLDLLITGFDYVSNSAISKIYKNNGNNTFTEQAGISLTGVHESAVKWGDYDNDGDLDILLAGLAGVTRVSKIYKNNNDGSFTEQADISLPGVYECSVDWGDYDNDGDLDILLTGSSGTSTRISKIYNNNGGEFEESNNLLTTVSESSVVWGDYDTDGDLDILLTGLNGSTRIAKIYKNNSTTANTAPTEPTNLSATPNGSSTTFSWNKSTDTETSQNGLTYNLYIGSTSGGVEKMPPMANITSGYRRIVQIGNTGHNNSITISGLTEGTYFWGVQAIDAGFKGSPFATLSSPLPVELTSFTGTVKDGKVDLNWKTASEINNYGFEIERKSFDADASPLSHSKDNVWQNVGFVEGHGNSNSNKEYSFTDKSINGGGKLAYRLKQIDTDGSYSYSETVEVTVMPNQFELSQNYPNPFNPVTKIKYSIPGNVETLHATSLRVYDILGNEVATLVNEQKEPGYYEVEFKASHLTSGVYFYALRAGDKFHSVKKMMIIK